MSSSQVAGLAAIGADSVICAVSGVRYISNPSIRMRARISAVAAKEGGFKPMYDIGYESSLDYERILKLNPDIVLAYTVSGAEPQYITRLRSLGIRVLVLHDHLENHPLARAEYMRLYGALTGRQALADSLFEEISSRYESLAEWTDKNCDRVKVLLNVPYGDAWYIPGEESYMSRLIRDAGGQVLGSKQGTSVSGTVTLEQAYKLSQDADIWLNPGPYRTRRELENSHHAFPMFGPLKRGKPIYNNTLRTTPEGGNDFWESGSVRPDIVLEDMIKIFSNCSLHPEDSESFNVRESALVYHFKVE
jgi:iron complex transport system substrate-binding protein